MIQAERKLHVLVVSTWYPTISKTSGIFIVEQARVLAQSEIKIGHIFSRLEGACAVTLNNIMVGLPKFIRQDGLVNTHGFSSWAFPAPNIVRHWFSSMMLQGLYFSFLVLNYKSASFTLAYYGVDILNIVIVLSIFEGIFIILCNSCALYILKRSQKTVII
jgi:hypothetical protein